jgi:uracil-DNA glycosylase
MGSSVLPHVNTAEGAIGMKIDELNQEIRQCQKCRLCESRTNALCGEGNLNAKLMLIAQAPGYKEDTEAKMFIGPSGKVLDELLELADIDRKEVYMTNLVKCMLPKYRKPKQDEIEACHPYLDREIELIDPEILAPLGFYAIRYIFEKYAIALPSKAEFRNVFGQVFISGDKKIIPLQHPASVLYNHAIKPVLVKNYRVMKTLLEKYQ